MIFDEIKQTYFYKFGFVYAYLRVSPQNVKQKIKNFLHMFENISRGRRRRRRS